MSYSDETQFIRGKRTIHRLSGEKSSFTYLHVEMYGLTMRNKSNLHNHTPSDPSYLSVDAGF